MTHLPKGWSLEYINKKQNMQLLHNLGVSLLDIYPREMKTCVHKQSLYPKVFSSFIHHSHKLQATQMSFNERAVKQQGHMHAMELLSGMRGKEPRTHTTARRNLQRTLANENSQALQVINSVISVYMTKFETSSGVKEGMGLRVWVMKSGHGYRRAAAGSLWRWPHLYLVSVQAEILACSVINTWGN